MFIGNDIDCSGLLQKILELTGYSMSDLSKVLDLQEVKLIALIKSEIGPSKDDLQKVIEFYEFVRKSLN